MVNIRKEKASTVSTQMDVSTSKRNVGTHLREQAVGALVGKLHGLSPQCALRLLSQEGREGEAVGLVQTICPYRLGC